METAAAPTSRDDGRPQYFIRNSDSSVTSGDDSSDDSSFHSSGAGAECSQHDKSCEFKARPGCGYRGRGVAW